MERAHCHDHRTLSSGTARTIAVQLVRIMNEGCRAFRHKDTLIVDALEERVDNLRIVSRECPRAPRLLNEGVYLNQHLLDHGHAERMAE